MNIIDKKKIVRSSITQAGVPILFDEIISGRGQIQDVKVVDYTENGEYQVTPDTGFDAIKKVNVTVNVAGGSDDPDPLHYHIGDIVLYDAANDKKVKTTKDAFNLEKYPADNFTPIGVIFHVNEDGSGRMISLAGMSAETPDTGSDVPESLPWGGYNYDIPELDNYIDVAVIDDSGVVTGSAGTACVPTLSFVLDAPAFDNLRFYLDDTSKLPSPYNADGSMNSEFFKRSINNTLLANSDMDGAGNTVKILSHQNTNFVFDITKYGDTIYDSNNMYFWTRHNNSDNNDYWFYTTDEAPTADTEIWIIGNNSSSFVLNYGTINSYNSSSWVKVGTVGDGTHITGGVTSFTDGTFTRKSEGIIYYYWQRYNESDGNMYFLYTNDDPEHITNDTLIYILGYTVNSFVYDYGTINRLHGTRVYKIGVIGDSTKLDGGAESFLSKFTHLYPSPWKTSPVLVKDGYDNSNFPAACSTWRYHTPGTKQGDWYLPAAGENLIISANFDFLVDSLRMIRRLRSDITVCGFNVNVYWSSTECTSGNSSCICLCNGSVDNRNYTKYGSSYVRAVTQVPALT